MAVGKKFGYKFKPWQAANIAKNIGNVAKVLGPVLSVIGVLFDVKETVDDQTRFKKVQKAQLEYRQMFIDIYDDLERQYSDELSGIFDVFTSISEQITDNRAEVQKLLSTNDEMNQRLLCVRKELSDIQKEIF